MGDKGTESVLAKMNALARTPPQVLLLEGGSEAKRLSCAIYWAKLLNCPESLKQQAVGEVSGPCGHCAACAQIEAGEHLDLWQMDGRISNKEDEESPGLVRALNVDNIRNLKAAIGIKPHGHGKRVVILQGMGITREEALNTLLKTLEEPGDYTCFVMLAPQREQLIPTLVSRAFCITLAWEDSRSAADDETRSLERELAGFIATGHTEFLNNLSIKDRCDAKKAVNLLKSCQRALARLYAEDSPNDVLDKAFGSLSKNPENFLQINQWLLEGQEMLTLGVSPQRVLEAISSKLHLLAAMR